MSLQTLAEKYGIDDWDLMDNEDMLPCFAARFTVINEMDTEEKISEYISVAAKECEQDLLVFSVTEQDKCWKAWEAYAKKYPRKLKFVEARSIHYGKYKCRMYFYKKRIRKQAT